VSSDTAFFVGCPGSMVKGISVQTVRHRFNTHFHHSAKTWIANRSSNSTNSMRCDG
jgi:hypothetical protein